MKRLRVLSVVGGIVGVFLCAACVSLAEKAGRLADGSALAEKTLAVYEAKKADGAAADIELREMQNKAGERSFVISLQQFPAIKIRCSAPSANADTEGEFYLLSLDYLGGSVSGWNEYRLELSGTGQLLPGGATATLSIPAAPQTVQITGGKIHRYDTRLVGDDALANLRNRRERVLALAEWMNGRENAPQGLERKQFEKYWKPLLFPEMVPAKQRPADWLQDGDRRVKAEEIRWNTGYTERAFPEQLWAVRNSGTMLRDWEEALEWIYTEYEWERITNMLSGEITLKLTKPKNPETKKR